MSKWKIEFHQIVNEQLKSQSLLSVLDKMPTLADRKCHLISVLERAGLLLPLLDKIEKAHE